MTVEALSFESAAWGPCRVDSTDIDLLAEFTGRSRDECVVALATYRLEDMAASWREANPETPAEMRDFYSKTDHYLWELLAWNGSSSYSPYLRALGRLAELWPPSSNARALDYGSGVGTAAIRLAELGYRVTLADVPGRTLDFARARLDRRGFDFDVLPVVEDVPELPERAWNVVVCFDVLEHLPEPDVVAKRLVKALQVGGGAAIVANFVNTEGLFPHHLAPGIARFEGQKWELYLQRLGTRLVDQCIYERLGLFGSLLRRGQYRVWRMTGLYVQTVKR